MSSLEALRVTSLSKRYGTTVALRDVSFAIPRGQACAVIGPNGAGKTTLVEIILNLRKADEGTVLIHGVNPVLRPDAVTQVGVQLQDSALYPMVRVKRYLRLFQDLYNAPPVEPQLLERLGLVEHLNKKVGDLSGGIRQRLRLAFALVNKPNILILDEPTTGLDPIARDEFWSFIRSWRTPENTVLLTSHLMEEVEQQCDQVMVLANHQIVASGTVQALLDSLPDSIKTLNQAYGELVKSREA